MNTSVNFVRRGYELLVAGGNLLQSPLLLFLRAYFFWQLFMTGQGHLAHIGKVADFFVTLGTEGNSFALSSQTPTKLKVRN